MCACVAVTERGLQDVGSVFAVLPQKLTGATVDGGAPLLQLQWDGLSMSNGDELYHTKWASVEGDTTLLTPQLRSCTPAKVTAFAPTPSHPNASFTVDEEDWLVELELPGPMALDTSVLLRQSEYLDALRTVGRGRFGEDFLYNLQ